MLIGHGDDIYNYRDIHLNFSSNVYNHVNHDVLKNHIINNLDKIKSYPEPEPLRLESALAEELGVSSEEVMACNGATEAIYLIAKTFHGMMSTILEPTFSEYEDACRMNNHTISYAQKLMPDTNGSNLVWLCNPNNPTGQAIPLSSLTMCIANNPDTVFVIDSSYEAFTYGKHLLSKKLITNEPNIISIHSMTKRFAVPGLRLGYIISNKRLISELRKNRMPWSVNALAQEAGLYLIKHKEDYELNVDSLIKERERVAKALKSTQIIEPLPSDTHILLCKLKNGTAANLKDYLAKSHGILIRDASNFHGLTDQYFRIAIQTPEEDDQLIDAIRQWTTTL